MLLFSSLRMLTKKVLSFAILLGMVVLAGCQSDPDIDINSLVDSVEPADVLYNQALANMSAGKMTEATRKFDAIDRRCRVP